MEQIKRPRGRPKLSEEEKARRRVERAAKKSDKRPPEPPKPQIPADQLKEIERITQIMARADELKRQQRTVPTVKVEPQGNTDIIQISPAKEPTIEDETKDTRPQFIQDDERGWEDPA